ncbi:hypothetical protein HN371_05705 [Candidatus Poribacteria bacterium]|jgi:hypothetical protein|nr:hypothetical protein [Candidatus Poribacteria bacterium]MBT5536025.1 hypothetical protein [Candidatus Poribacteria bacterium]MBT5712125.1 hypothetical protein [Candidatus Poribacteria bacterium]MBT7806278.1 hypothetical protein [Candidatus Poribacteria bacterium]
MPARSLPAGASLSHLRSEAKALLAALRADSEDAARRFLRSHPRAADGSKDAFVLADAQLVVAREYGFASWPRMKRRIEHGPVSRTDERRPMPRSLRPGFLAEMADALLAAHTSGRVDAAARVAYASGEMDHDFHGDLSRDGARGIVAWECGFAEWEDMLEHARAAAASAEERDRDDIDRMRNCVHDGDVVGLAELLARTPSLIHERPHPGAFSYRSRMLNDGARIAEAVALLTSHGARFDGAERWDIDSAYKFAPAAAAHFIDHGAWATNHGASAGGRSPLHYIARMGSRSAAASLLARGATADLDLVDESTRLTPLGAAVELGHARMARFLLAHGANPDLPADEPERAAWARAEDGGNLHMIAALRGEPEQPGDDHVAAPDGYVAGRVRWFGESQGYFTAADGSDVFLPRSAIHGEPASVEDGVALAARVAADAYGAIAADAVEI